MDALSSTESGAFGDSAELEFVDARPERDPLQFLSQIDGASSASLNLYVRYKGSSLSETSF